MKENRNKVPSLFNLCLECIIKDRIYNLSSKISLHGLRHRFVKNGKRLTVCYVTMLKTLGYIPINDVLMQYLYNTCWDIRDNVDIHNMNVSERELRVIRSLIHSQVTRMNASVNPIKDLRIILVKINRLWCANV